jgi:hypothetical protein
MSSSGDTLISTWVSMSPSTRCSSARPCEKIASYREARRNVG